MAPTEVTIDATPSNIPSFQDNVTLTCSANGGPPISYQWQKNGMTLSNEDQSTLQLNLVSAADGGEYTCVVSNAAGSANTSVMLYIQPYIVVHPQQQILASLLENVTFICVAEGFPPPSYSWMREGSVVSMNQNYSITASQSSGGVYTCMAFSSVNSMELRAQSEEGELIGEIFATILFCTIGSICPTQAILITE